METFCGGPECPVKAVNGLSKNRSASIVSVKSHMIFRPEDGSNTFLRNLYAHLPNCTTHRYIPERAIYMTQFVARVLRPLLHCRVECLRKQLIVCRNVEFDAR